MGFAGAFGTDGQPSDRVLELGWLNASFESGYANPIDTALRDARPVEPCGWVRAGEVPYDFTRRRLTVLLDREGARTAVTKGQLRSVLAASVQALGPNGRLVPIADLADTIGEVQDRLAESGMRTLGVAWRDLAPGTLPTLAVEEDMVFAGILAFSDPPKADARAVLDTLDSLGVAVVVITGDDRRCAAHIWRALRGRNPVVVGADELHLLGTEALERRAPHVQVFAEVEPLQKERIVRALRSAGHVVAYLGDGINDAPALRASDVGISVEGAADVAREAADVVLRQSDLGVLATGIQEGRRTLANSLKYVYFTTSANFGNMLSMAVASSFLPFLPLLPKQILLNNFLSDLPAMAIAGDHVDHEQIARPGRWRTPDIRRFMIVFGSVSSAFDLLTFGVLIWLTGGAAGPFRTGWFVESLLTEVLVLFVMRSPLPLGRSRPGSALTVVTLVVASVALLLPYTPFGEPFGLEPLPPVVLGTVAAITLLYVGATELTKRWFFARS